MDGFRISGQMVSNNSEIAITSFFIKKEDSVFAFHGLSSPSDAGMFTGAFANTAYGFNTLTDKSLIDVSPARIRVHETDNDKLLSETFNDLDVPEEKLEELTILNGLELDDLVKAGTKIKIVS